MYISQVKIFSFIRREIMGKEELENSSTRMMKPKTSVPKNFTN